MSLVDHGHLKWLHARGVLEWSHFVAGAGQSISFSGGQVCIIMSCRVDLLEVRAVQQRRIWLGGVDHSPGALCA